MNVGGRGGPPFPSSGPAPYTFSSVGVRCGALVQNKEDQMTQRESRLSHTIMVKLRENGAWCFKVHGGPAMMTGLPDIIGCYQGRFFGVETKIDTDLSLRQRYVHRRIREAGGTVVVAHSVREALTALVRASTPVDRD